MSSPTFVANYTEEEIQKAHEVLRNEGLRMRIKVNGEAYVEKALTANKNAFAKPMQDVRLSQTPAPLPYTLSTWLMCA